MVSNVGFRLRSGMGATLPHTTTKPDFVIGQFVGEKNATQSQ